MESFGVLGLGGSLRAQAAARKHNAVVGGVAEGAIAGLLLVARVPVAAAIVGVMGVVVVGLNLNAASKLEQQAKTLEQKCAARAGTP